MTSAVTVNNLTMNTSEWENMNLSTSSTEWMTITNFWIEGILTPLISVGGLAGSVLMILKHLFFQYEIYFRGNLLCIIILSQNKAELDLKHSFTNLLICLVSTNTRWEGWWSAPTIL